jgi:hypothetical protein
METELMTRMAASGIGARLGRPEGGEAMSLRALYAHLQKRFG